MGFAIVWLWAVLFWVGPDGSQVGVTFGIDVLVCGSEGFLELGLMVAALVCVFGFGYLLIWIGLVTFNLRVLVLSGCCLGVC